MKFSNLFLAMSLWILSVAAFGDDTVSVNVNGRVYQCSNGGSGGAGVVVRYYSGRDCAGIAFQTAFTGGNIDEYCQEVSSGASYIVSVESQGHCDNLPSSEHPFNVCKRFAR
jgi:hypothetical protein